MGRLASEDFRIVRIARTLLLKKRNLQQIEKQAVLFVPNGTPKRIGQAPAVL
jgi:hypothetical protein